MKLTAAKVRAAKPEQAELLNDGNGLYLRVRPTSKTWLIRRKRFGRIQVTTLGNYPALSLQEARLLAAADRLNRSGNTATVSELVAKYTREIVSRHRRPELATGYMDRAVLPNLGHRKVREISRADLVALVQDYTRNGARTADALRSQLRALFGYAAELGWCDHNPAAGISTRVTGYTAKPRERVLSDDEIRLIWHETDDNARLLRFLLLTGLRISEAQKGHRLGDRWVVPAELSKNSREHWVHLTQIALEQLPLPECSATNVQSWLKRRCAKWKVDPAFTPHDLRRSFSTRLHDLGTLPHVVEKCLNHTMQGVLAAYNRAEYEADRIAAYERIEQHIREVAADG